MGPPSDAGEWQRERQLVQHSLDRLERDQIALRDTMVSVREDLAALRVKAGVWGLMGGMLPAVLTIGGAIAVLMLK